jgi:hypothetical protein
MAMGYLWAMAGYGLWAVGHVPGPASAQCSQPAMWYYMLRVPGPRGPVGLSLCGPSMRPMPTPCDPMLIPCGPIHAQPG